MKFKIKKQPKKEKLSEIKLRVVEALQDDAYKGIARIDVDIMRNLGIGRGDAILIKGNRETVAIADRAYPADVGERIIRIDGILRRNAKVGIGDKVILSSADLKEAKKIIISPAQKGITVQSEPESLKKGLLGRVLIKGDFFVLGRVKKKKDLREEEFEDIDDIFGDILGGMGFGNLGGGVSQIKFLVKDTDPNLPVIITEDTKIILEEKFIPISEEDIPKNKLVNLSKLPDLKDFFQLKDIEDLFRITNNVDFVNKFEEPQRRIYLVGNYFLEIKKKSRLKK